MPDPTTGETGLEALIDHPLTKPESEEGIGPILGEDVSVAHEDAENARHGATDVPDADVADGEG